MKDEIKKAQYEINILSNTILDETSYIPTIERRKLLLDYITNLQEELEEEKRIEQKDLETIQSLEEENEKLQVENKTVKRWYQLSKSRIDKAIEYIDKNRAGFIKPMNWLELRNILQGEDKE